jgi:F0F1-type ATP synthase membrane subunit b/b'
MSSSFWVAVSFVLFSTSVIFFLRKKIIAILDSMIGMVRSTISESEIKRIESEKNVRDAVDFLEKTKIVSESIIKSAQKEASNIQKNTEERLNEYIDTKFKIASSKIAILELEAINDIKRRIVQEVIINVKKHFEENNIDTLDLESLESVLQKDVIGNQKKIFN